MKTLLFKTVILSGLCLFFVTSGSIAAEKKQLEARVDGHSYTSTEQAAYKLTNATKIKKHTFKEKLKLIKQIRKERKKVRKIGTQEVPEVVLYILAIILPPLAVGIFTDWGEPTLWNLLFTILFWIPGVIHAFYILLR